MLRWTLQLRPPWLVAVAPANGRPFCKRKKNFSFVIRRCCPLLSATYISRRSTLMPQDSVASSKRTCIVNNHAIKSKKQSAMNPILLTSVVFFLLLFNQMSVRVATTQKFGRRTLLIPFTIITFFIYLFPLSLFIYWSFFLLLSDAYQVRYLFHSYFICHICFVVFLEPLTAVNFDIFSFKLNAASIITFCISRPLIV